MQQIHAQEDFLPPEQAFRLTVTKDGDDLVRLNWKISEGYYLYRKQLKVEGEPTSSVQRIESSVGTLKTDEFFGETEVYHDSLDVLVKAPDAQALNDADDEGLMRVYQILGSTTLLLILARLAQTRKG